MKVHRKLSFFITLLQFALIYSDISDDECGVWVEEETTTISSVPEKIVNVTNPQGLLKSDEYFRKRLVEKSLVIVFDGTHSMIDNLVQMRDAAKEIISSLSARKDQIIRNYVLMVFNDPIENFAPIVDTTDPNELFKSLDNIKLGGPVPNPDEPELSMTGLKLALERTMRKSLVYVFTDATAKDHLLISEVLPIVDKKQVKVSFLITSETVIKTDPGYQVYEKIASTSEGQVFIMSRDIIKSVLKAITQALDPKFETLASMSSDKAGSRTKKINVDKSFSAVSVSLSGSNSTLTVKDSNNVEVTGRDKFASNNIKFISFDVSDSSYTIEASADSAYSVRVGGISELKFEFGFSTNYSSEQAETATQPLGGFRNVLSIFVSDHDVVKCLTRATLLPAIADQAFDPINIPLERTKRNIYSSDPFEIPSKMFKIKINGYDIKGNVIERLISSGIESVDGFPPEIEIESSGLQINQYGNLSLNCKVTSLTPARTVWMFESDVLNIKKSNQSTHNFFILENFEAKNVGKYICKAENSLGSVSKDVSIAIKIAPTVKVKPDKLMLRDGEIGSLECVVEGNHGDFKVMWKDENDIHSIKNLTTYKFVASRHHHNTEILCEVTNDDFVVSANSTVTVIYAPELYKGKNSDALPKIFKEDSKDEIVKKHVDEKLELSCQAIAHPSPEMYWTKEGNSEKISIENTFTIESVQLKDSGSYWCHAVNEIGEVKKKFGVKVVQIPFFVSPLEDVSIVKDESTEVQAFVDGDPNPDIFWFFDGKLIEEGISLKLSSSSNQGTYKCVAENPEGKAESSFKFQILTELKFLADFDEKERIKNVKQGDDLELLCPFENFDKLLWMKDGRVIALRRKIFRKINMNELAAGEYKCIVRNAQGIKSFSYEVNLLTKPQIAFIDPRTSETRFDTRVVEEVERNVGDELELICESKGNPKPDHRWLKNRNKISKDHKLKIESLTTADDATYICIAENSLGTAWKFVTVKVMPKPYGKRASL